MGNGGSGWLQPASCSVITAIGGNARSNTNPPPAPGASWCREENYYVTQKSWVYEQRSTISLFQSYHDRSFPRHYGHHDLPRLQYRLPQRDGLYSFGDH